MILQAKQLHQPSYQPLPWGNKRFMQGRGKGGQFSAPAGKGRTHLESGWYKRTKRGEAVIGEEILFPTCHWLCKVNLLVEEKDTAAA